MNLNQAISLWDDVSPARKTPKTLTEQVSADVVIIGGGIVGLSSALQLAKKGYQVVLLEAKTIGSGASGRNNGQVIPVLSGAEPAAIERRYGETGERFVALIRDSASDLFQLAKDEKIDCEAEQTGWFQPAHSKDHLAVSQWRNNAWEKRGAPCKMLDGTQSKTMLGSSQWYGGMFNPTGGHINPKAFVLGLANACERLGVQIFENTPALDINKKQNSWIINTPSGYVKADAVLLATNAYSNEQAPNLAPKMAKTVVPVTSFQIATKPLDEKLQKSIIPNREAVSDTRGDLQYFRYDARNRLVSGGALIYKGNMAQRLKNLVGNRLAMAFPQLGVPEITHVWSGYVGITMDRFPHFYKLGDNFWSWSGCNGRGLALGVSLGREFANAIEGKTDIALLFEEPKPIAFHSIVTKLAPSALAYYRWLDGQKPKL